MSTEFRGRTAIVTGASRGIGEAVSKALGAVGVRVAMLARSGDALARVAEEISVAGGEAIPSVCDLSRPRQLEGALDGLIARLDGRVDILVNNAAVFLEAAVPDTRLEQWEALVRLNLTAPYLLCRRVLPIMVQQRGGRIVNIASTSGLQGYLHQSAYCATKHGLVGFSRSLAVEAKPHGVRVHVLCPGGVNTTFIAGSLVAKRIEGQAVLEPENIADLVLFLLRQPANVDYPEVVVKRFHTA